MDDDSASQVTLKNERRGPPPTSIEWMIIAWVAGLYVIPLHYFYTDEIYKDI